QVSYTNHSDRWYLPSTYYFEEFLLEDSTHVLFVFMDTNPLSEHRIDSTATDPEIKEAAVQLKWLNETLSQSQADWKIVIGHHPLYSVDNKHRNNPVMIDNVQHVLEQHQVHAYFSGHAHSLQHLKPAGTVEYFISGSGSKTRNIHASPIAMAAESVPGFIAVSLTNESLTAQFVDFKGESHHEAIIYR
ncbi:MAG: metallophosphoesterase, partial [Rhodothermaceae bacterium]|nr:metallophosphoesterase [Rhodothermaceae bacterium]